MGRSPLIFSNGILFFFAANLFAANPIIIGGRGGTSLYSGDGTAFGAIRSTTLDRNFSVGPTLGVRLPLNFSIEGDALYNRRTLGLDLGINSLSGLNTHSDWWEFPVQAKFTAGRGPIAPVLGAGFSVQHLNGFGSIPSYLLSGSTSPTSVGFVASGGLQFRVGALHVTPEFRYTHWSGNSWTESLLRPLLGSRDQAQFLVGFTF
jgi:hypothetical protein